MFAITRKVFQRQFPPEFWTQIRWALQRIDGTMPGELMVNPIKIYQKSSRQTPKETTTVWSLKIFEALLVYWCLLLNIFIYYSHTHTYIYITCMCINIYNIWSLIIYPYILYPIPFIELSLSSAIHLQVLLLLRVICLAASQWRSVDAHGDWHLLHELIVMIHDDDDDDDDVRTFGSWVSMEPCSKCLTSWHQTRKCLRHCLRFFLRAHQFCLRAYLVVRGACAGLRSPEFGLRPHPYKGPLPEHEHEDFERGCNCARASGLGLKDSAQIESTEWECSSRNTKSTTPRGTTLDGSIRIEISKGESTKYNIRLIEKLENS